MNVNDLNHKTKMWILAGVILAMFVAALDSTIVGTAMPQIIGDLQGIELYTWPFTIYLLCMATTIPIFGRLADMLGFKPIFFAGMLLFLAGSALCGLAQNMYQLILFRGIQGLGGGMLSSNSLAIIGAIFAPAERAKYIPLGSSMMALASIVGPTLGGAITDQLTWRWVFYINLPIGAIALTFILLTLPHIQTRAKRKIDYLGVLVFILFVVPFLLAFTWAGDKYEWASAEIIGLLSLAAVMLLGFIWIEHKAPEPIVPMRFFKVSTLNICNFGMLLLSGISIGAMMFIPLFIQGVIGASATDSGMIMTPFMLSILVATIIGGVTMSKTLRYKALLLLGYVVMAAGLVLLTRIDIHTTHATMIYYMILMGAGMGLALPIFSLVAQNTVPQSQVGSITSLVQFFRLIGATMFSAVFGSVMIASMRRGLTGVSFNGLPEQVTAFLKNPQAIASTEAVNGFRSSLPAALLGAFETALEQVRVVFADTITTIFLVCIFIVAAGLFLGLFLREVPLKKEILHEEQAGGEAVAPAE